VNSWYNSVIHCYNYYTYVSLADYVIYCCRPVISYCVKHLMGIYGELSKLTKKRVGGDHIRQTGWNQTATVLVQTRFLGNQTPETLLHN
jgi:hypothetical protein